MSKGYLTTHVLDTFNGKPGSGIKGSIYIFEEARNILIDGSVNVESIFKAFYLNGLYLFVSVCLFYYSFSKARKKGTLINIGE